MSFIWFPQQTVIIYLYSISLLVFIAETGRVYCSVKNEPLTTDAVRVNLSAQKAKIFLNFAVTTACCSCSPPRHKFTKINPFAVKSSNLLFPSVCFNVYHNSKFYRPCSKPPISPFCFHFHATFISEQTSEAEEEMLFLQANENVPCFHCLSLFFYPSTISYFSLPLSYCSERENARCINIHTVASMQRIKVLHETLITESPNGLKKQNIEVSRICNL